MPNQYYKTVISPKLIDTVKLEYSKTKSLTKTRINLNISRYMLDRIINENNIEKSIHKITTVNEDCFKHINTCEKAYWLGFLYADGSVSEKGVELSSIDKEHLVKFRNFLQTDSPIHFRKTKAVKESNNKYSSYRICIYNQKLINNLIECGCVPNKSPILKFPKDIVPINFHKDFIRGYFDGDGSISFNEKNGSISFLGNPIFINEIQTHLINNIENLQTKKLTNHHSSAIVKYLIYGGKCKMLIILYYLYNKSSIFLERKYNKYINLYNEFLLNFNGDNKNKYLSYWYKYPNSFETIFKDLNIKLKEAS